MRFQPQYVPNSPESPMRTYVTSALRSNVGFGSAGKMSETMRKVRAGERHPMLTADKAMRDAREHGASWSWAVNVVRAFRQSAATIWGVLPTVTDPRAAHIAETDAECEANKLQARVFSDLASSSDADIEAFMSAKEVEMWEDERLVLACAGELLRRANLRTANRRRLGLV